MGRHPRAALAAHLGRELDHLGLRLGRGQGSAVLFCRLEVALLDALPRLGPRVGRRAEGGPAGRGLRRVRRSGAGRRTKQLKANHSHCPCWTIR